MTTAVTKFAKMDSKTKKDKDADIGLGTQCNDLGLAPLVVQVKQCSVEEVQ